VVAEVSAAEIISKSAYAERLGVAPSAISNYVARGKLTAPALRHDGMIDVALADAQLGLNLDLIRSAGRGARPEMISGPSPEDAALDRGAARSLLRARAAVAEAAALKAQIELGRIRGELVDRTGMEDTAHELGRQLRESIMTFVPLIAAALVGLDAAQIEAVLSAQIERCLNATADELERLSGDLGKAGNETD
jgi:hypothetical protein